MPRWLHRVPSLSLTLASPCVITVDSVHGSQTPLPAQTLKIGLVQQETEDSLQRDDAYHMPMAYDQQDGARQNERYSLLTKRFK